MTQGDATTREAPSFRYRLPDSPVATATADIGHVGVRVDLSLAGELEITTVPAIGPAAAPHRAPAEMRACTLRALRTMARGLMVTGLGSYTPTINSAAGSRFVQTGYQFHEPNTMAFAGGCTVGFAQRCDCGSVAVAGEVQYCLDVTAMPHNGQLAEDAKQGTWFVRFEEELASIGMLVLAGVPIAPDRLVSSPPAPRPETPR